MWKDKNMTNMTNSSMWKDKNMTNMTNSSMWKDKNMTNMTNSSMWKDRVPWGKRKEEMLNMKNATNCICGSVPGHWEFIGRHGKWDKHWGEDDKEEREGSHHKNDDREQSDEKKKKHKGSRYKNEDSKQWDEDESKDVDIGLAMVLFAGGTL